MLRRVMMAANPVPVPAGISWDPANSHAQILISNSGRTAQFVAGLDSNVIVRTLAGAISGKRYWEIHVDDLVGAYTYAMNVGIQSSASSVRAGALGSSATSGATFIRDGRSYYNTLAAYRSGFSQGDVVGIAIDRTANRMWFAVNGVWGDGSSDPAAGTGYAALTLNGSLGYIPAASLASGSKLTANFSPSDWVYPAPAGFVALG